MTAKRLLIGARYWALFLLGCGSLRAADTAVVKADQVAVRAAPSARAERLRGNLTRGEKVRVLEEVDDPTAREGEPRRWAKIEMPDLFTVWLAAELVDSANSTVKADHVNLRAGPGKNFSPVGQISRGQKVTEIRTEEGWMQIEAPRSAVAYVAADLLQKGGAQIAPNPPPKSPSGAQVAATPMPLADRPPAPLTRVKPGRPLNPPPSSPPPSPPSARANAPENSTRTEPETAVGFVEPVRGPSEPPPTAVQPVEATPTVPVPAPTEPTTPAPAPPPIVLPPPTPTPSVTTSTNWVETRRKVIRQGYLAPTLNPKAPSGYALRSRRPGEGLLNYVYSADGSIPLRKYSNSKVIITGEEWVGSNPRQVPILMVESIVREGP